MLQTRSPYVAHMQPICGPYVSAAVVFGLAAGRLKSLSHRFEHDPALLTQYNEVIENQLNKGIIERAPPDCQGSPTHYLPHQPVITPNKATTKLRVVYDASSKTQKTAKSLNDCLHRGPLLLPDLCGLLLRCRLSPVVLLAETEKAFLQVGLHPADRDATRFLFVQGSLETYIFEQQPRSVPFLPCTFWRNQQPLPAASDHSPSS